MPVALEAGLLAVLSPTADYAGDRRELSCREAPSVATAPPRLQQPPILLLFIAAIRPEKPGGAAAEGGVVSRDDAAGDPERGGVASVAGEHVGAMDVAVARLVGPRSVCQAVHHGRRRSSTAVGTMHVGSKALTPCTTIHL